MLAGAARDVAGAHHLSRTVDRNSASAAEGAQVDHALRRTRDECVPRLIATDVTHANDVSAAIDPLWLRRTAAECAEIDHSLRFGPREKALLGITRNVTHSDDFSVGV